MSRVINNIVIHCADTPNGVNTFTVNDIDNWHKERGFQRSQLWRSQLNPTLEAIGYHFVIYCDGQVKTGRHVDEIGAHVQGCNADSLGVCLFGRDQYTEDQWEALKDLLTKLKLTYPTANIRGHYEFASAIAQGKKCPNFDVPAYAVDYVPDDRKIYRG